jgi:hypothetical protein
MEKAVSWKTTQPFLYYREPIKVPLFYPQKGCYKVITTFSTTIAYDDRLLHLGRR